MLRLFFILFLWFLYIPAALAIAPEDLKMILDTCAVPVQKPLIFYHWGSKDRVQSLLKASQKQGLEPSFYNHLMKPTLTQQGTKPLAGFGIYVASNLHSSSGFGNTAVEIEINPGNYILNLNNDILDPEKRMYEPHKTLFKKLVQIGVKEGRLKPKSNGSFDENQLHEVIIDLQSEILQFPFDYTKEKKKYIFSFSKNSDTIRARPESPISKSKLSESAQSPSPSRNSGYSTTQALSDSDNDSDDPSSRPHSPVSSGSDSEAYVEFESPYEWLVVKTPHISVKNVSRDPDGNPLTSQQLKLFRSAVAYDSSPETEETVRFYDSLILEAKRRETRTEVCMTKLTLPQLAPAPQLGPLQTSVQKAIAQVKAKEIRLHLPPASPSFPLRVLPPQSESRKLISKPSPPQEDRPSTLKTPRRRVLGTLP